VIKTDKSKKGDRLDGKRLSTLLRWGNGEISVSHISKGLEEYRVLKTGWQGNVDKVLQKILGVPTSGVYYWYW